MPYHVTSHTRLSTLLSRSRKKLGRLGTRLANASIGCTAFTLLRSSSEPILGSDFSRSPKWIFVYSLLLSGWQVLCESLRMCKLSKGVRSCWDGAAWVQQAGQKGFNGSVSKKSFDPPCVSGITSDSWQLK